MHARVLAGGVVVLLAIVVGDAFGQQYTVTDLGTLPGGGNSYAYGVSENGLVCGSAYSTTAGVNHAFLYSNGTMQDIGTIAGGADCWGFGVNDSGQVAGYAYSFGGQFTYAFAYSGGTMVRLTPTGENGTALCINNSGQVVVNDAAEAFIYNCNNRTVQYLTPPWGSVGAFGINQAGQFVDPFSSSGGAIHLGLYSNGVWTDLGMLPSVTNATACFINDIGQVAGDASINGTEHIFLYSSGTMQDMGALPAPYNAAGQPTGINDSGRIVGWSENNSGVLQPFIVTNGALTDLNSLIPTNSGWTLEMATGINNSGEICGYGINPSGQTDALLLTPVPEPSALTLFVAVALAMLAGWRLRPGVSIRHSRL